jgi:hypothetical protein
VAGLHARSTGGLDAGPLRALAARIRAVEFGNVDRMVVVRNGALVWNDRYEHDYRAISRGRKSAIGCGVEACAAPADSNEYNYLHPAWHPWYQGRQVHTLQSVTKSVASVLIGIAIARGEIPGVEAPLEEDADRAPGHGGRARSRGRGPRPHRLAVPERRCVERAAHRAGGVGARVRREARREREPRGFGYGYQWWRMDRQETEIWGGLGFGGQILVVLPQQRIVGVVNSWNVFGQRVQPLSGPFIDALIAAAAPSLTR